MESRQTALVLGATWGIGSEMARQLRDAGWQVRALQRGLGQARPTGDGIEWVRGDAMSRADVLSAASGCAVIVHAVNPPGYRRWAELVLPMLDNTMAAAVAQAATIVLPGTVYNYGPDAFSLLRETSEQHPMTRKGAIRVELERRLEDMATAGAARAIVVRAGDFFGPKAGNNWFSQGMVKPGRQVSVVHLPGTLGVGHQMAYLPDVARTMVELLARRQTLPAFAAFHMAGHWDPDGLRMAQAVQRVAVRHGGKLPLLKPFPWWLVRAASPLVATFREMLEMRYLWQQELRMDNAQLVGFLGHEPHTPLDAAMEATLAGMGCLDGDAENAIEKVACSP
ncbi:MAG TPA: NAD-dependent epimerase/dehydratase family protein [Burkholderiaceae bacterium]